MTEFILIRHGSTENLEAGQWQGWSPVPLSRLGEQQARAAALWVAARAPVERVFSSPIARARQTAEIVAAAVSAEVENCDALKERMTATRLWGVEHAASLDYSAGARAHRLDPEWRYEDEETWASLAARVLDAIALMQSLVAGGGRFVLVTHGITLRLITAALLAGADAPLRDWLGLAGRLGSPECCSVSRFSAGEDGLRLEGWNLSMRPGGPA